jgi:hypothetical protein
MLQQALQETEGLERALIQLGHLQHPLVHLDITLVEELVVTGTELLELLVLVAVEKLVTLELQIQAVAVVVAILVVLDLLAVRA